MCAHIGAYKFPCVHVQVHMYALVNVFTLWLIYIHEYIISRCDTYVFISACTDTVATSYWLLHIHKCMFVCLGPYIFISVSLTFRLRDIPEYMFSR